jgi:RNA polymerase sigma factor (sigma-70 family)
MSDQEVIDAIRSSNRQEEALRWVYQQCTSMVKGLGRQLGCSPEVCADVLQEAILLLYTKAVNGTLTLTAKLTTYVYEVSRRMFLHGMRDGKRLPTVEIEDLDIGGVEEEDLSEVALAQEQRLAQFLNELGDRCRDLIVDFYFNSLAMKDLAMKYNYSNAETVTSQKYKCFMQLKRKFQVA